MKDQIPVWLTIKWLLLCTQRLIHLNSYVKDLWDMLLIGHESILMHVKGFSSNLITYKPGSLQNKFTLVFSRVI